MESLAAKVNGQKPLTIFAKLSVSNVYKGPDYAPKLYYVRLVEQFYFVINA